MMRGCGLPILIVLGVLLGQSHVSGQAEEELQLPRQREPVAVPEPQAQPFRWHDPLESDEAADVVDRRPSNVAITRALTASLDEMDREHALRMRRIQEKLSRLRLLAESCKDAQASDAPPTETPTGGPPVAEDIAPPRVEPVAAAVDPQIVSGEQLPVSSPLAPPTASVSLTSTVDLLALANNLFAQGKVDAARPVYEKLLAAPQQPSDLVWIQYQLASCYRTAGNPADAKKLYRIVASAKDEEYWSAQAHWWLNYLDRKQALIERQQGIQTRLDTLKKESDELRQP